MKKYLTDVLQLPESYAEIAFVIVCVTAPVSGISSGGFIIQKLGGYHKLNAIYIIAFNCLLIGCIAIIIGFTKSYIVFGILVWIYLFFGSMIDPCLYGSLLASLPLDLKGCGYSLTYISTSILGVSTAPFMYGFIYELTKEFSPSFSMSLCLSLPLIGSLLAFSIIRNKRRGMNSRFEEEHMGDNASPGINNKFINDKFNVANPDESNKSGFNLEKLNVKEDNKNDNKL